MSDIERNGNDIALIRLPRPAMTPNEDYNENVLPICIPWNDEVTQIAIKIETEAKCIKHIVMVGFIHSSTTCRLVFYSISRPPIHHKLSNNKPNTQPPPHHIQVTCTSTKLGITPTPDFKALNYCYIS